MNVLIVAMPDRVDWLNYYLRLPNLAAASLAGNLPGHSVKVLDLVCYNRRPRKVLERVVTDFNPRVVGLSAMSFQFNTLTRVARLIRGLDPNIKIVAGGYHATLMSKEIALSEYADCLDFLVRGEGEQTFRQLVDELGKPSPDFGWIDGLSYRQGDGWQHNASRQLQDLETVALPRRRARISRDFYFFNDSMDVVETSRGCPNNCKFCSITHMYGRTFRTYSLDRIVADLKSIRDQGTKAVFFADDNITYDIEHLKSVCGAIIKNGLTDMYYMIQASAADIAKNPWIALEMAKANFHYVFLGIESMSSAILHYINKPTTPAVNQAAAEALRRCGIGLVAGLVAGYPDDTKKSIKRQYRSVRKLRPCSIFAQYLTPYPKTEIRRELVDAGMVTNLEDFSKYDGFTCNVRTKHLSQRELYVLMKRESVKSNAIPLMILGNRLIKDYGFRFIKAVVRTVAANILHDQLGLRRKGGTDL